METQDRPIVLVEDTLTQAMLYQHMLEKNGFQVRVARSGKQALEQIENDKPVAVLTDINMPEMSGFDLCKTIKSNDTTSDIIVVLLTTTLSPEAIFDCLNSGADEISLKSLKEEAFVDLMKRSLDRRLEVSDQTVKIDQNGAVTEVQTSYRQSLRLLLSVYDLLRKSRE